MAALCRHRKASVEQIRPRTAGNPERAQLLLGPACQAGPHMPQQEQAWSQPVGAINSCGASKGSANPCGSLCQHHPWASAVPLKKLQRGIGIPVLPGAHLPIPKGTVLLCKCDGKATTGSCHGDSQGNIFCQSQGPAGTQKALVVSLKCAVLRTITDWSR